MFSCLSVDIFLLLVLHRRALAFTLQMIDRVNRVFVIPYISERTTYDYRSIRILYRAIRYINELIVRLIRLFICFINWRIVILRLRPLYRYLFI